MSFIPAGVLAQLTTINASAMPDRCDLYDAAAPRAVVQAAVRCRLTTLEPPAYDTAADRPEVAARWTVHLPTGTDVQPDWQLRLAADTASVGLRGRVFTVTGDAAGTYATARRVLAEEAQ